MLHSVAKLLVGRPSTLMLAFGVPIAIVAWDRPAPAPVRTSSAVSPQFAAAVQTAAAPRKIEAQSFINRPRPEPVFTGASARYREEILQASRETGVDPQALIILLSIECPSGNPSCHSYADAQGLFQVMPGTAVEIQSATGWPCVTQPYDPLTSIRCGSWYFAQQMKLASELWVPDYEAPLLGAAGMLYNGGPGHWPKIRQHVAAGGRVCEAPVYQQQRDWCNAFVTAWREAGRQ